MKNLIYISTFILITSAAVAQEKPKEAKEETEVKVVKIKDGEKTTEKKVKVITRETAQVTLNEKDKNSVNQSRVQSASKVEKMIMVDNDTDGDYDMLTKETYYQLGDKKYLFTPNKRGFNIAFNKDENKFVTIEEAITTDANGHYLVNGETYAGVGYFNTEGDFVIQYYNKKTDTIETKIYKLANVSS
ncbi:hypothetical protein FUA26_05980 [Seonamhaeicola algicola]|uniref:Uncharacterized protein n=1 Tax=Seonamhaeicola algicola TaxID=1719036 RepID=A0A5C7AYP0_9FLAO|nr:hypothetical protein [Seonamhaeicola algicola]TXE11615.1 hypothetical protein FUA26_05980 [Seonamhaeicola algicola]